MRVIQTRVFRDWLAGLRDSRAQKAIAVRIERVARSNFGDVKGVGGGISELRIHLGPGYRVYLTQHGDDWVVLLCGGIKDDQSRDIQRARELARSVHQ
jgi:putative addiction module killer protein